MFDYELIRLENEEKNEEARIAYFEFHFDDETEIDTEVDTEIETEIVYTLENF
jgi:hypothetical protein